MSGLNAKQAAFVREYLVDLNATKAAIRAGYSPKTAHSQGPRLLENAEIRKAVDAVNARRQERTELSADYVLSNLREVVERCMQRAPVMVREGRHMVQLVDEEGRHVWEFNANGANKALESLGKHLKLFTDKVELSADSSFADLLKEARARATKPE